ncbi:TatD family hydrolase [Candidatus Saccharibacteria bacterium]|nr:TatD family hydrolase [Candidatus Saccharibacteria bacterium]
MSLVDTHAHIHFDEFSHDLGEVFGNCRKAKVNQIICVGVNDVDSQKALDFVSNAEVKRQAASIGLYATAGLHPHEASRGEDALLTIKELIQAEDNQGKIVAVGECGLDYYRNLSGQAEQQRALEFQLELAAQEGLPVVFHIRDGWEDFWTILKNYPKIQGVIHSFTGGPKEVEKGLEAGLYFGLNGIMTFTRDANQLKAAELIPDDKILLETDCPYLAPVPYRGKRNEPAYVLETTKFLADLRGQEVEELASISTSNVDKLFNLAK